MMNTEAARNALRLMPFKITLMLVGCLALIIGNAGSLWANLEDIENATAQINQTWAIIDKLRSVQANLVIAESGQRGFLLTGDATYLDGYDKAETSLPDVMNQLALLIAGDRHQLARFQQLRDVAAAKLAELQKTVSLTAVKRTEQALGIIQTDAGKRLMDEAFEVLAAMESSERGKLLARNDRTFERFRLAANLGIVIGTITLAILLLFYAYILRNVLRREEAEALLRSAKETLEAKVATRTAQLSHLSRHLLQIAETEKAALANELHDELGSNLTAINLDVTSVATRLQAREPAIAERLNRALRLLHETVDIKRRLIQGLRPSMLDSLGLCAALRMHCEDFTRRTNLPCDAECPDDFPDVDPSLSIAMYRVAQEALNNIAKYAKAQRVRVVLRAEPDGVVLRIIDDGVGIDPDATDKPMSHGLLGMRERMAQLGGKLVVRPGDDGAGTTIDAFVPLPGKTPVF